MRGESPHSGGLRRKSHFDLLLVVLMVVFLWGCGMSVSAALATVPSTAIRYTYTQDSQLSAVIKPEAEYALYTWDAAGNLSSIAKKSSTKLSIIQLEPSKGAVGETVDIWGTGFSTTPSNDTVKFHGTAATVSAATAYTLAVKVPTGATTGTVTVQTTTEGPVTSSQTFTVASAVGAPTITSLSASVAELGATVTVSGTNFETTASDDIVRVNQTDAEVTSASGTSIKFKVPAVTTGGHVSVTTPQGSVSGPVLYVPPEGIATSKVGATEQISSGKSVTVKLSTAETVGLAIFEATAGEHIAIVVSEQTIHDGGISVFSPQAVKVREESFPEKETRVVRLVAPTTGMYTILVKPEGTYTGSVKLSTVPEVTESITPTAEGAKQAVSITTPYQQAYYLVAGKAGQSVSVNISGVSFSPEGGEVEWVNSDGVRIRGVGFGTSSGGFVTQVKFSTSGTYTLVVSPYGVSIGSLTLTVYEASDVTGTITPSAEGEMKSITTSVPGQYARITFPGTEGERVSLVLSEANYGHGYFTILNFAGEAVTSREYFYEKETLLLKPVKLPTTGTYTILIEPGEPSTGTVKLAAYSVTDVTGSITPTTGGVKREVSLKTPGQRALYTVSGTAGEIVSVNVTGVSFSPEGGEVEWVNSEGVTIRAGGFGTSTGGLVHQVEFPTTGTYTLIVQPDGISTGSLTLTVYEAPNVTGTITPTTEGESKTVTISVPGQYARITFPGTEGQTITLKARESTIAKTSMSVLNPEGSKISEAYFGSEVSVEDTLSATGTYTILLEPEGVDTGSLKLTAYLGSHPGPGVVRGPSTQNASTQEAIVPMRPTPSSSAIELSGLAALLPSTPGSLSATSEPSRPAAAAASSRRNSAGTLAARVRPRVDGHPRTTGSRAGTGQRIALSAPIPRAVRAFRPRGPLSWNPPAGKGWVTGEPVSPWVSLPRLQAFDGATALSGRVLAQNGLPLGGVRVAIEGTYLAATTDEAGRFLLSGAPAGHQVLVIEGESTRAHQRYGSYETGVQIKAGETTVLPYTIWLTPLDPAGDRDIVSPTTRETRITTPQIPGLEVRLPAGTVIHDAAGHVVRKLNITAIPVDRPPFPLPFFSEVPIYFTVQPGRAYLSKGARIVYPNYSHLRPGSRVDFWNYDPTGRGWYIYGQGTVTPNGKQVVPDPGVRVWEFTGAMFTKTPKPPHGGPKPGGSTHGGDPVDLGTGLMVYRRTDLVIPDTIPIVVERTYRQGDSNSYSFGVGTTNLYDLRMWSENNYHEVDLVLPNGGTVLYKRTSSGEGYVEAEYKATETPGVFDDSTVKWDPSEPGWELTLTNGTTYIFGELAPLEAIRNKQGQQLTITRSEGLTGNITQITSPHGHWVKFTYNGSNNVTEIKDNIGRTLKYAYNKEGFLESATDPAERTTKYGYNTEGDMTSITDPRGNKYLETTYSGGLVSKQTMANSGTYEFSYALKEGNVESTTVTEPRGNKRKVTFNTEDYPTSETAGLGSSVEQTTTFERQAGTGLLLSSTDARSRKTAYEYNSYGNVTAVTRLAGTSSAQTYKYAYEPDTTELTKETDPLGHATTYEYNSLGELTASKDALGHTTHYEYNSDGQPTVTTNPLGKKTTTTYELGAPVAVTDPLGRTTKQFVDAAGRVLSSTLPGGQKTAYEYNNDNQVTKMTDPIGNATTYEYDADGDLTAITDPLKNKTTYAYTKMDLLESETDALEKKTTAVYDTEGNLTELTDRRGKLDKFTYDPLNRLTEAKYSVSGETAESTIKYEYDNGNRLTKIIDSTNGTYTPEYDELNRLKSLTTPQGTVKYEYDEANRRTSMTVPGQEALKYTYDEANRLKELKRGSQSVSFAYNEANMPTATTLPDGVEEQYGYDEANEMTSIAYKKGATTLGELDYSYDLDGRREAVWGSYARTALPEAFSSAKYNADNEQTERASKKLSYDADGNLTSDGTNEYTWNARGQLTKITGTIKDTFAYNPFGQRTSRTIGSTTTELLYDGPNVVQEIQGGKATANILTGPLPSKVFARTTSKTTENLLTDALGSTIALAGSTGSVETSYTYDPFGTTTKEGTASENTTQYAGQEDEGNGIYYDRARYYSPAAARFLSQDPTGPAGGPNLYLYTGDSPTNAVDPYGTHLAPPTPSPAPGPGASSGTGAGGAGGGGGTGGGASGSGAGGGSAGGGFGPGPGPGSVCGAGGGMPGKGSGLSSGGSWVPCLAPGTETEEIVESEDAKAAKERSIRILEGCGRGGAVGAAAGTPGGWVGVIGVGASGCLTGAAVTSEEILQERAEELLELL